MVIVHCSRIANASDLDRWIFLRSSNSRSGGWWVLSPALLSSQRWGVWVLHKHPLRCLPPSLLTMPWTPRLHVERKPFEMEEMERRHACRDTLAHGTLHRPLTAVSWGPQRSRLTLSKLFLLASAAHSHVSLWAYFRTTVLLEHGEPHPVLCTGQQRVYGYSWVTMLSTGNSTL